MANKKLISIVLCVVLALIALFVPAETYGIDGLTVVEQRVIAIFILAALLWITEPIPIWTTSVFIMVLMLVTVTDSSFAPLMESANYEKLGPVSGETKFMTSNGEMMSVADIKSNLDANKEVRILTSDKKDTAKVVKVVTEKQDSVKTVVFTNSKMLVSSSSFKVTTLKFNTKDKKQKDVYATVGALKVGDTIKSSNAGVLVVSAINTSAPIDFFSVKVDKPEKSYQLDCGVIQKSNELGSLIKYKDIMAAFANPVIMLFLGGFVLAIAAGKIGLDGQLAKMLLHPFGRDPKIVMLGFLIVTGVFSMFMSNTATAAMMLAIMAPVFKSMQNEDGTLDRGVVGLAMAIPIGANIGGMGTPIGTPPNGVAMNYLNGADYLNLGVGFLDWMIVMFPIVIIIFVFAWFLLVKMYPFSTKEITLKIDNEAFAKSNPREKKIICVTFAVTILLWVTDKLTGINANVVALVPFAALSVTGVFTKKDLSSIDWDVLWLVAGGFAIGIGLENTGLAEHMVNSIPFGSWSPVVVILGSGLLCLIMSTFMSNSASAALLIPIMYTVGKGMMADPNSPLAAFGGVSVMLIGVAVSASLAMALPISTPPNALAYSTGTIKQKDMATVGIIVGLFGFVLAMLALLFIVGPMNIFG